MDEVLTWRSQQGMAHSGARHLKSGNVHTLGCPPHNGTLAKNFWKQRRETVQRKCRWAAAFHDFRLTFPSSGSNENRGLIYIF
jgi:hypothetical protein